MWNRLCSILLLLLASATVSEGQQSPVTYTLPATGATAQWVLIGTFTAGQQGHTVMISAFIHAGFSASVMQDSTYSITFKTSNGSSVDSNGFAGDGSWNSAGYNTQIAPGNIKWVANAAGAAATAFNLYIYLPNYVLNSQYTVSVDSGSSWTHVGATGQTDPGAASNAVMIPNPGVGFMNGSIYLPYGSSIQAPGTATNWNTVVMKTGFNTGDGDVLTFTPPGYSASTIKFFTSPGGGDNPISAATEKMRITYNGNVGIGTPSPTAKLHVSGGSIQLSGTNTDGSAANVTFTDGTKQITAWTGVLCGGDYAEAVNASGGKNAYEPGDVLVLTSDANGDVQKSSEPYSTMVAGIYATKPGVIGKRQLAIKDSDEVPMAMVGIVPTKVTAENGPIHRGDLLVSSSKAGYAMKGTDRTKMLGAVIGKAMGTLESGTGVVEVLVTLQ